MATIRNYNAWIKAARKAAAKTGGLSIPAARKAYRKMSTRLGRPLKGTDVKKHPIIFKRSIPVRSGGIKPALKAVRRSVSEKRAPTPTPRADRRITSLDQFEALGALDLLPEESEFVSTAQYK